MAEFRLRPSQQRILAYRGGRMGISAVPGSGKTFTLSRMAADILLRGELNANQEVLIVTLVNSAVDNFSARITGFLAGHNRLPGWGYRVRTLHGLAHDIVRERPESVGLADDFQIADETEATGILTEVSNAWLHANLDKLESYLKDDLDENTLQYVLRRDLPNLVRDIAQAGIGYAKDRELTPEALRQRLDQLPIPLSLAEMGWSLYADYQRSLNYRGAVDFDDLIRLALLALKLDDGLVERLRNLWPYILEDEAQDSSRLQEEILHLLAGPDGNWVRVGDPNQAIYETFTTADPKYLLDFREEPGVQSRDLPESGRSAPAIIALANRLTRWSQSLPEDDPLSCALALPEIKPTPPGDPQPNPEDTPRNIHLSARKFDTQTEESEIVRNVQAWLEDENNRSMTVAILVPRNERGFALVDALRARGVSVVDSLMKTSIATRTAAAALDEILRWLANPLSGLQLSKAYRAWRKITLNGKEPEGDSDIPKALIDESARWLNSLRCVEDYTAALPGASALDGPNRLQKSALREELLAFRELAVRWQSAAILPVDQLILTLAQDLFTRSEDLAVAHKLAALVRQRANAHPDWSFEQLCQEVGEIARNKQRFAGFSSEDTNFNPDLYPGKVVVATIHKAKGLEWDRVYLLSANTYDFPSGEPTDTYIAEKWFIRDHLNLQEETLAQLESALSGDEFDFYEEGDASRKSREEYARERLRLLYVGITRARRQLIITWNTGRKGDQRPARALMELLQQTGDGRPGTAV